MSGDVDDDGAEWIREDIKRRGAKIAYATLIELCQNPKAQASARARASVAVLEIGGLSAKAPSTVLDMSEMSGDQLRVALQTMRAEADRLENAIVGRARLIEGTPDPIVDLFD